VKSLVRAIATQGGKRRQEIAPLRLTSASDQKKLASILSANLWALEAQKTPKPYDAILVDEAQDIEQALWTPIQKLLRDPMGDFFYVFYDERQRIDLPGNWVFRPAGQKPRHHLTVNCRNTRAIYGLMCTFNPELASYPFEGPPGRSIEYIDLSGGSATEKQLPKKADGTDDDDMREHEALVRLLDDILSMESGLRPEDVLIITCRSEERSRWYRSEGRNLGRHQLRWLHDGRRDGQVAVSTIRSAKGLEAKVVIIAELDGIRPINPEKRNSLLYIAISRAVHHVVVLGTESELIPHRSLWGSLVSSLAGM
jgi:superfamily I DNA/RNA helicase